MQKVGSQAFVNYIEETSKDFISFKTEISLKDIGNDPVKRAELIIDLVQTITKIPDAIKRSIFYKEVAKLLNIEESLLISEGNKISLKQVQEKEKEFQRNKQRTANMGGLEVAIQENTPLPNFEKNKEVSDVQRTTLSYHEEECVRLLVCYGKNVIEHNTVDNYDIRLADYIFQEIKDLAFETPVFEKILHIFRENIQRNEVPETLFLPATKTNKFNNKLFIGFLHHIK